MSGRIVIAGAGVAGATAARTLRAEGYTGRIVLVGAEHHAPYRRPMVSKDLLAGVRGLDRCLLEPERYWAEDDIDLRVATTVADIDVDRGRVWLSDGESLALSRGALVGAVTIGRSADIRAARKLIATGAVRTSSDWADESLDLAQPVDIPAHARR